MAVDRLWVVGGGLAGSEAAWQIAEAGVDVVLFEMRPHVATGAHRTDALAELVCSNSLGSLLPDRASGVLMAEARRMGSLLVRLAEAHAVPAGAALAVDRQEFALGVTQALTQHPRVTIVRQEIRQIPQGIGVLASGPLTSPSLAESLRSLAGVEHLYFFDALSPIVEAETVDATIAYRASRYGRSENAHGDYLNCPLDQEQYDSFVAALAQADRIPLREFEQAIEAGVRAGAGAFFEGCLPVEILARRDRMALAFGPLRPVGLKDPRSGRRPYAVVQLRQDNLAGTLYNLVGFQTNLTQAEQVRVFRMIPGLGAARFARYGQMHRNTFVNAPQLLEATLQMRRRRGLFLAGQITGVEGYLGNIATGLLAGRNAVAALRGDPLLELPRETMLGALCHYVSHAEAKTFQPMKANFGLLPPLTGPRVADRRVRQQRYAARSETALSESLTAHAGQCA
ncbi:MAG TPA: methylenetetrahydrofolate--tRNA-(uracil(54)-C(5))-methyltransferase (FADH(2)-oxidizing) TrmFO [Anaerolineales bacterium]|nr:methylenetetrahydrofolate--tRNA-(uracil(54)-C(5))-methyltransferase (FADH(2)-oxidizing) TrmFO [Anaerolineales bacterium]